MFQYFNQLTNLGTNSWVIRIDGSTNDNLDSISVDSDGHGYVSGYYADPTNNNDVAFFEYSASGEIVKQKLITVSGIDFSTAIAFNSNGVFVASPSRFVKTDLLGNILWQFTTSSFSCQNAKLNSSSEFVGVGGVYFFNISNSGSVNWVRKIDFATPLTNSTSDMYISSSGNLYFSCPTSTGLITYKVNSSGTAVWQKKIGDSLLDAYGGICTDSAEAVYVFANTSGTGRIIKYNSSGTLQWQKSIVDPNGYSVQIFSSFYKDNYIYACGFSVAYGIILKFDTDGNLVWSRKVTPSTSSPPRFNGIWFDEMGFYHIAGFASDVGNFSSWIAKFPTDGTLTGTYAGFSYENANISLSTSSLSDTTDNSNTLSTVSASTSTTTYSITDMTLPWTKSNLGS